MTQAIENKRLLEPHSFTQTVRRVRPTSRLSGGKHTVRTPKKG